MANDIPPKLPPKIIAAPKIRQIYWCDFGEGNIQLPEMWKERPVVVISYKHTLHGHCLVAPTSTDPQEGDSAKWAYKLSIKPDGVRDTWVVCNHLYTVATSRLSPVKGNAIPRIPEDEFNDMLVKILKWLPTLR